jgi:hypothetical protein
MRHDKELDAIWASAPAATESFDPARVETFPSAARRFLKHTLAPGAPVARAAWLTMHGTIRLGEGWFPFEAEQVLSWDRGFIWHAAVRSHGIPITGTDRLLDGEGAMRWKILGLVPFIGARGPEITRSAAGRLHAEAVWLPGVLLGDDVAFGPGDDEHADVSVVAHGETTHMDWGVSPSGGLSSLKLWRWGNPEGREFHYEPFGGEVLEEMTVSGITIPSSLRLGWHYGTPEFDQPGGEFFRVTVDSIEFK